MFIELETLLDTTAPYLKNTLIDALKTFDRIELPNYQDGYLDLLMLADTIELSELIDNIRLLTLNLQSDILKAHEVVLIEDVTIQIQTIFINAILDIQEYDDIPTLLKTASLDLNPNEVLAELVSLVSHKDASELLADIYIVSDAFIMSVKEFCNNTPDSDINIDNNDNQKYIDAFNKFTTIIDVGNLEIVKLLNNAMDVGYDFNVYLTIIGRDLEDMSVITAAHELIGCALISADGNGNPIGIISKNIDNYISDMDKITKINIEITNIILKLQRN